MRISSDIATVMKIAIVPLEGNFGMSKSRILTSLLIGAAALAPVSPSVGQPVTVPAARAAVAASTQALPARPAVHYRTVDVEGVKIFYREAGPPDAPTILLLHGFPSSSHMFRDLIPLLATRYHVVAPDYPGFGYSDQPSREQYQYSFDQLYRTVDGFTRKLGLEKFAIYVQDYGSPIGLRIASRQPDRVTAIIVQNGNAYDVGLAPIWDPIKAYWAEDKPERREALREFLTEKITTFQYSEGVRPDLVSPDAIRNDQAILDRPGNADIQLDLFRDYRTNLALYPEFQRYFRERKPPILIAWGKNDPIFAVEGAKAFLRDQPEAELHLLDAGHFALETHSGEIAALIDNFLKQKLR